MKLMEFPDCCGGLLLSQFGGTSRTLGGYGEHSEEEINKFFNNVEGYIGFSKGFALLTLNNEQIAYMKPYLDKFGYRLLEEGIVSPGHSRQGSTISIYIKSRKA